MSYRSAYRTPEALQGTYWVEVLAGSPIKLLCESIALTSDEERQRL